LLAPLPGAQVETAPADDETTPPIPGMVGSEINNFGSADVDAGRLKEQL